MLKYKKCYQNNEIINIKKHIFQLLKYTKFKVAWEFLIPIHKPIFYDPKKK